MGGNPLKAIGHEAEKFGHTVEREAKNTMPFIKLVNLQGNDINFHNAQKLDWSTQAIDVQKKDGNHINVGEIQGQHSEIYDFGKLNVILI